MERGERGEKGEEGHSGMCGRGEGTKLRGDDDVGVGRYKCLCSLVGSGLAYLLLLPPSPFTLPLTSFPLTPHPLPDPWLAFRGGEGGLRCTGGALASASWRESGVTEAPGESL